MHLRKAPFPVECFLTCYIISFVYSSLDVVSRSVLEKTQCQLRYTCIHMTPYTEKYAPIKSEKKNEQLTQKMKVLS